MRSDLDPLVARAIGQALRSIRLRRKLTYRDAAALIGRIDAARLCRLEDGQREPSVSMLRRIAAAYRTSVGTILRDAGIR